MAFKKLFVFLLLALINTSKYKLFYSNIYFKLIFVFCMCLQEQLKKLKHANNVKHWAASKEKQAYQCEANKGKFFHVYYLLSIFCQVVLVYFGL